MDSNILKIKEKFLKKELVIGTHVVLSSPEICEILCFCGFDVIWIDGEHGPIDKKDINLQVMTVRSHGLVPFVRIPWNDPVLFKPILDMGPGAIVVPFIKTAEDAKLAVASCKYPPSGIRGFGPHRANNFSTINMEDYLKKSETEPFLILQIEHIDAVNNLKDIIKVQGIDSVCIGNNDLSGSMGLLGQTRNPEVLKILDKIAYICNEANFSFGTSLGWVKENISDWIKRGVSWITIDTDISYLINGGKKIFESTLALFNELRNN
jgi:2-keto-3-deoxy-L-rhamnonate aldolase RhmA